jgi:hypothetical protein
MSRRMLKLYLVCGVLFLVPCSVSAQSFAQQHDACAILGFIVVWTLVLVHQKLCLFYTCGRIHWATLVDNVRLICVDTSAKCKLYIIIIMLLL